MLRSAENKAENESCVTYMKYVCETYCIWLYLYIFVYEGPALAQAAAPKDAEDAADAEV